MFAVQNDSAVNLEACDYVIVRDRAIKGCLASDAFGVYVAHEDEPREIFIAEFASETEAVQHFHAMMKAYAAGKKVYFCPDAPKTKKIYH